VVIITDPEIKFYKRVSKNKLIGVIGTPEKDSITDFKKVKQAFFKYYIQGDFIVSGGYSKGGDGFAKQIAKNYGIPIIIFHTNQNNFNKEAIITTNTNIAEYSDILIACVSSNISDRTEDIINKFKRFHSNDNLILVN